MIESAEITAFSWAGALLLALCGVPVVWRAFVRPESSRDLSWVFLGMWGLGELFMLAGLIRIASWPVLVNYAGNVVLISIVCGIKYALPARSGAEH